MKVALCNEVVRELEFENQCTLASSLGYDGLEVAPFTLSDEPHRLSSGRRQELRRIAEDAGIRITGLHWLLVTPPGLSITSPEQEVRKRTSDVIFGLIDLCAELGGGVLVHGSPKQRLIAEGQDRSQVLRQVEDLFKQVAGRAEQAGVVYCIEPLSPAETNFINGVQEAAALVERVGQRSFRTMLDTKAMAACEAEAPEEMCDRWLPTGMIGHIHVNDRKLRGPGQGEDRFTPLLRALIRHDYQGVVGVEPFQYIPDGPTTAARSIGYLHGILESLSMGDVSHRSEP